jgi:integrase
LPNYREKLTNPLSDEEFIAGMNRGPFVQKPQHPGYIAFLHYTGLRMGEALNLSPDDFTVNSENLMVSVAFPRELMKVIKNPDGTKTKIPTGKIVYERFKHSKQTPPLPLSLDLPFIDYVLQSIEEAKKQNLDRVWPYCRKTGYNIVHRVFKYPHYHRLSRITWFFQPHPEIDRPQGFSIAEVRSWTGLSLKALDYYVGLVGIERMGQSLLSTKNKKRKTKKHT